MSKILGEIFVRPVDRAIEGVIKADDDASLRIELDEYVLTNEIERKLEAFVEAYTKYETANGVWISGFFGSGKSHLLKMLALLLENRTVDGVRAYDLFAPKCEKNEILAADLKRAVEIPSHSILFNIDQKADVISKTQIDALLSVFQKVFDELSGYYGKQPHIAQFERDLDSRNVLAAFREAYAEIARKPWERGRETTILESGNIGKAYSKATGAPESEGLGILDKYRRDYRSSIEDFADRVKAYVDAQGSKFRLNFFVDEVGQYIADNVKLMTNLQTIAESLNTKCRGRAWILVTAQQDMNSVIGDMTQRQANDFSKIQARFANRIPLNSADVAEVIQERLLKKTGEGIALLEDLHHVQAPNLKTLFDFADGSIRLENFRDRDHFIRSYPFIPYQYSLFQMAIQNLSEHNAFEGKHSSVGERSMLGVFQDVAKTLAKLPVGRLATFDQMFEGIRTALKSNVQQSILTAEGNLGDAFATRVLKALFLVKYVKPFKATARNIAILLQGEFDIDQTQHRRAVEHALSLLEQQTYIQRNGDLFEFLTNEEKDVEQEIKSVQVDASEVGKKLQKLIFESVIIKRKIRHEASGQDFSFAERLDDKLMGRDYELAINVITPFHDDPGNESKVRMRTLAADELAIVLPADERFRADLLTWQKTDKYVRQNGNQSAQPSIQRIVREKGEQNAQRDRNLEARIRALLSQAQLYVRGEKIEIRSDDAEARITKGFQALVGKVYTSLPMLRGETYTEADVGKFLRQGRQTLEGLPDPGLTEPEQEIVNIAQFNARLGVRTTVKAIVDKFEVKPYGWSQNAILALTAGLFGRGKFEASSDGAALEGPALESALRNSQKLPNIVLEIQAEFTPGQVRKLKEFYSNFFDVAPAASEAKALGQETEAKLKATRSEIADLLAKASRYPFVTALEPLQAALGPVVGKPYGWYLTELEPHADKLLDLKEDVFGPIKRFLGGAQKQIFDEASEYLASNRENLSYAAPTRAKAISDILADPACFKSGVTAKLKTELDGLRAEIGAAFARARADADAELAQLRTALSALPEWPAVPAAEKAAIETAFDAASEPVRAASVIGLVQARVNEFRSRELPRLLERAAKAGAPVVPPPLPPDKATEPPSANPPGFNEPPAPPPPPPQRFVSVSKLPVTFAKAVLDNETDVADYVETLRKTLLAAIRDGKRISL